MSLTDVYTVVSSHMVGDYVLQTDYIAKTKGENWWHMIAHCVLYTVPFAVAFGVDWRIVALMVTHLVIDALKARWRVIGYVHDQILHVILAFALYL